MMKNIFQQALGVSKPWYIESIEFDKDNNKLDIFLNFYKGSTFTDKDNLEKQYKAYDCSQKTWRHLNFFQHECYLHARIPRIKRDDGKTVTVIPDWSGKINGFTLLFEAFLIQLCIYMPVHNVSKLTGISDYKLWNLLKKYVDSARKDEDLSYLHSVGMDETSVAKGHDYITLFVDLQNKKTVYVAEGKGSQAVKDFAHELQRHNCNPNQIKEVSCDMSPAFIKGVRENLTCAKVTFDKFHIIKLINEAVDKVRREEAQVNPILKGARYALLKNKSNLSAEQKNIRENLCLSKFNLKSIRAMNIRETFQQLYQSTNMKIFEFRLQSWYFWATHSRLNPIIKVAKTIKKHWNGVLQWEKSKLNNGLLEGLNSVIQAAKRKARGYKKPHFKIIAYLLTGKLNLTQVNKYLPT